MKIEAVKKYLVDNYLVSENEALLDYLKLVSKEDQATVIQKHHAIPICSYKILNKEYKNFTKKQLQKIANKDKSNFLINLKPSNHILAHYYLYKCSINSAFKFANFAALKYLVTTFNLKENTELDTISFSAIKAVLEAYDKICEEQYKYIAQYNSKYYHGTRGKVWINNKIETTVVDKNKLDYYLQNGWQLGRLKVSAETKQKVSVGLKKYYNTLDEESKQKIKDRQSSYIWVVKQDSNKEHRIKKEDLQKYFELGFVEGRLPITDLTRKHLSDSHKGKPGNVSGRKKINNGQQMKTVKLEELADYLAAGWVLGELPKSKEWLEKIKNANLKKDNN